MTRYVKLRSESHVKWDPDEFDSHRPAQYHDKVLTPVVPRFPLKQASGPADVDSRVHESAKIPARRSSDRDPLLENYSKLWLSTGDTSRRPRTLKEAAMWTARSTASESSSGQSFFRCDIGFTRRASPPPDSSDCFLKPLFV